MSDLVDLGGGQYRGQYGEKVDKSGGCGGKKLVPENCFSNDR